MRNNKYFGALEVLVISSIRRSFLAHPWDQAIETGHV